MTEFYEEVDIVFRAKVVRLKGRKTDWVGELYSQLDYLIRSDKNMLVGLSKLDTYTEGKTNEDSHN